ncbi:hypothetical protein DM02DRAFT_662244 [Periconia macrospinosa]|uniref:Uncharacterized protein n=1 Tax=Periconia macrospinosa TaxID=97972 RepID=A0A2V1D554_9PLEO|nr:hypothetical protein DM02DRAFT_662244 [Periconia macrospinosa]
MGRIMKNALPTVAAFAANVFRHLSRLHGYKGSLVCEDDVDNWAQAKDHLETISNEDKVLRLLNLLMGTSVKAEHIANATQYKSTPDLFTTAQSVQAMGTSGTPRKRKEPEKINADSPGSPSAKRARLDDDGADQTLSEGDVEDFEAGDAITKHLTARMRKDDEAQAEKERKKREKQEKKGSANTPKGNSRGSSLRGGSSRGDKNSKGGSSKGGKNTPPSDSSTVTKIVISQRTSDRIREKIREKTAGKDADRVRDWDAGRDSDNDEPMPEV